MLLVNRAQQTDNGGFRGLRAIGVTQMYEKEAPVKLIKRGLVIIL